VALDRVEPQARLGVGRIERERTPVELLRALELAVDQVQSAQVDQRLDVVGLERERALEQLQRALAAAALACPVLLEPSLKFSQAVSLCFKIIGDQYFLI
jgi:hypothetical protein